MPAPRGQQVTEFKQMVKRLHAAGWSVLDVVYNHTARAIISADDVARGLTTRPTTPDARPIRASIATSPAPGTRSCQPGADAQLIADSLRYWGPGDACRWLRFRPGDHVGREPDDYDPGAAFSTHPPGSGAARVKLMRSHGTSALWLPGRQHPGPCGASGTASTATTCAVLEGDPGADPELAYRLSGSSDLYRLSGRGGQRAGINFLTGHDGFTLRDLVTTTTAQRGQRRDNQDGATTTTP